MVEEAGVSTEICKLFTSSRQLSADIDASDIKLFSILQ